jgi:hypothetical protein
MLIRRREIRRAVPFGRRPSPNRTRWTNSGRAELSTLRALTGLSKFSDALAARDAAFKLAANEQLPDLQVRRARTFVAAGDHGRAAAEVRILANAPDVTADTLDGAARVLALAAGAAKSDMAVANGYAAEAVALLRRAHVAGQYREKGSADKLRDDSDFAALNERDEFRKLLAEFAGK